MIAAIKKLRRMCEAGYVALGNFSCNLCRNKIPTQVPGNIALYNRGYKLRLVFLKMEIDTSLSLKTISSAFANPKLFELIVFRHATKKRIAGKIRLLAAKGSLIAYDEVSSRF